MAALIRQQSLSLNEVSSYKIVDSYIRWYNEKRIKISFGLLSPIEYRASQHDFTAAKNESASVDPHHDKESVCQFGIRAEDVQIQTILVQPAWITTVFE